MLALIGNLGPWETVLLLIVVVLVFGGRLPTVARDAMKIMARVRGALDDLKREVNLDGEFRSMRSELDRASRTKPRISTPPRTISQTPDEPEAKPEPETPAAAEADVEAEPESRETGS